MRNTLLVTFAALFVLTPACGDDRDDSEPRAVRLDQIGLTMQLAGKVTVEDHWAGGEAVDVRTANRGEIAVEILQAPLSEEEARAGLLSSATSVAVEALADGFVLTHEYQLEGEPSASHSVQVYRTIGGRAVRCSSKSSSADVIAAALAACKSLQP
jgi:hypothetical protein